MVFKDDLEPTPWALTALEGRFLTERLLAERWAISAKTIRNWRSNGLGPPHVKLNGAGRYELSDVVAFEQSRRRSSTSSVISNG